MNANDVSPVVWAGTGSAIATVETWPVKLFIFPESPTNSSPAWPEPEPASKGVA